MADLASKRRFHETGMDFVWFSSKLKDFFAEGGDMTETRKTGIPWLDGWHVILDAELASVVILSHVTLECMIIRQIPH